MDAPPNPRSRSFPFWINNASQPPRGRTFPELREWQQTAPSTHRSFPQSSTMAHSSRLFVEPNMSPSPSVPKHRHQHQPAVKMPARLPNLDKLLALLESQARADRAWSLASLLRRPRLLARRLARRCSRLSGGPFPLPSGPPPSPPTALSPSDLVVAPVFLDDRVRPRPLPLGVFVFWFLVFWASPLLRFSLREINESTPSQNHQDLNHTADTSLICRVLSPQNGSISCPSTTPMLCLFPLNECMPLGQLISTGSVFSLLQWLRLYFHRGTQFHPSFEDPRLRLYFDDGAQIHLYSETWLRLYFDCGTRFHLFINGPRLRLYFETRLHFSFNSPQLRLYFEGVGFASTSRWLASPLLRWRPAWLARNSLNSQQGTEVLRIYLS
ncbi:uncharacterized protein NECHADRAFT_75963 [Fusarium vanettenii 77-13-4]|uniref:Uncharacterized protein n=1 Tax=Fusarium vanettenii (strain ATCC MYA-4622 / CBS 123669 / FGSC 9596 / NRRL 45880 / 77-13-4) TaxID=660122 RepID=C7Z636_FUSV7|nr:uncharacterized protein NECHADRAFT_75963 [Fusarium vanettenii 77-13-4]EEU40627.1 predicted protein [Fusarium vanettenii 77-13-4]